MPEPIDLKMAFGLPPEDAVAYFREKGYNISWDWWETWQQAHAKAFTVAKVVQMDVLKDIRSAVDKAIEEGTTFRDFRQELEPKLRAKGWWGTVISVDPDGQAQRVQLGSPWRLKNIYRTNTQVAYNTGRYKQMKENAEDRPLWQYLAIMDANTRPSHGAANEKVYPHDDPFWDFFYPPNGHGCRCRVRAFTRQQVLDRGLTIETAAGALFEVEKTISKRTGETTRVQAIRLTGPDGRPVTFSPDVGWNFNPAATAWQPDLDEYENNLATAYQQSQANYQAPER